MGNLTKFQRNIMVYCIRKAKYRWDFDIIISNSNTGGFAIFLTKCTYNNYMLHILYMLYITFIPIFA